MVVSVIRWFGLFPTLTCGVFVFSSVSAFRRLPPPVPSLTLTHSLIHSLTHSPTHSLTDTHSLTHSLTHSPTHSLTHSLAHFAWQAWDNVHCQGVGCTPWRPLGLRRFCVAGVGQCALPRGWVYALASLGAPSLLRGRRGTMCTAKGSDVRPGVPWGSAAFAWQVWDNVRCQGVRCTPWRPLGLRRFCVAGVGQCALPRGRMYALASLGAPPLLRGRRGTMCTAKGSDVRPGVPWGSASFAWQAWDTSLGAPPLLRGRHGTMCTAKGSDVRPGVPWGSVAFAWQVWDNVHCQGVRCTPWRPLGLCRSCVAGAGQCALPRGPMYALASLGAPLLLRRRRGTMCAAKGSDVRPGVPCWGSVSFAWQAWDNVHCQGVRCTPWRPLGLRLFCVAGVGQHALPRGPMYALASLGAPLLLRGRRGTMCLTHSLTHPPTHPPTHSLTHSLTYIIIIIMCQRCLPATGHAERVHKMCGCARKSAEHYFGQRKYGEHTIVLIVCREKTIRAWWNSMKAKQLTHKQLTLRTYIHRYLNTYIHTYLPTYIPPSSLHHSHTSSSLLAFCAPSKSEEVANMWGYPVL